MSLYHLISVKNQQLKTPIAFMILMHFAAVAAIAATEFEICFRRLSGKFCSKCAPFIRKKIVFYRFCQIQL